MSEFVVFSACIRLVRLKPQRLVKPCTHKLRPATQIPMMSKPSRLCVFLVQCKPIQACLYNSKSKLPMSCPGLRVLLKHWHKRKLSLYKANLPDYALIWDDF